MQYCFLISTVIIIIPKIVGLRFIKSICIMSTDHTEYLRKLTFKSELLIITSALPACFSSVDSTPASYFEDAEYRS